MLTTESFLTEIERFLKRTDMTPSAFGRSAIGDPNFVPDLREGRSPSLGTVEKIYGFIRDHAKASAA